MDTYMQDMGMGISRGLCVWCAHLQPFQVTPQSLSLELWLWHSCLYGHSFCFPALDTPHIDPYVLWWAYIHKSSVQTFKLQGFQTTTITLSSQSVQINYCRLQSWVFVKFKQIHRAPELCIIALPRQPAPSSSPRQSNALMGFLAHQLPSHQLRRCRSSRSLIQTRVFVLQLWNKEVLLTPNLASILSHFHK